VVIEFDRVGQARAVPDGSAYQEGLAALVGGAERDIRFVEGVRWRQPRTAYTEVT
jgi:uncharacterized protein (DUF1330 family)